MNLGLIYGLLLQAQQLLWKQRWPRGLFELAEDQSAAGSLQPVGVQTSGTLMGPQGGAKSSERGAAVEEGSATVCNC